MRMRKESVIQLGSCRDLQVFAPLRAGYLRDAFRELAEIKQPPSPNTSAVRGQETFGRRVLNVDVWVQRLY